MKIACLSGKGGAGKTLTAVNLAAAAGRATYIDCDVEEPNGRLFWKPEQVRSRPVCTLLPEFDPEKCTGCKACVNSAGSMLSSISGKSPWSFPRSATAAAGVRWSVPQGR